MDEVFNETFSNEEAPAPAAAPEGEATQQVEQVEGQPEADGETTSPQNTERHVPLAALEAERGQRKDWKEKALRYEGELKAYRESQSRNQGQQQPQEQTQQLDPIQQVRQEMLNERFNMSEMVARQKYADLDDVVKHFHEAVQQNPALAMALHQQANPYEFAYREGKRIQLLKEVGDDPAAYRAKVEAEIRAELQKPAAAAPLNLPGSLAGARSSAPRSAPAFTGPTPMGSLFNN